MAGYSKSEKRQIAAGAFFTDAELRANPRLGRLQVAAVAAADPNTRPVSKAARGMTPVCAYCYEPGDERSALVETARHDYMHPECDKAASAVKGA